MTGCKKPPATPSVWGPDSTWTFATYPCSLTTTAGGNVRYVVNWTDSTDTDDVSHASAETAEVDHVWSTAGTFDVKAQAILDADPSKASGFSQPKSVKVILNQRPIVDSVQRPYLAVKGAMTNFVVFGSDPDYDSVRAIVKWPNGKTTTGLSSSPGQFAVSDTFTNVDSAAIVVVWVQDWKGSKSKPDTIRIPVTTSGGVLWSWQSPTEQASMSSTIIVANDGTDELILGCCTGEQKFYAIKAGNKAIKRSASTVEGANAEFVSDPGLNASGHIIVGDDDTTLYAISLSSFGTAWTWQDTNKNDEWGAPALSGSDIYIGREDHNLYHFTDNGSSAGMAGKYGLNANVVDAPVVDADGNVLVGTDSGYLTKFDKGISSPIWRSHLIPYGEVNGIIIGSDKTIYCGSDSPYVYAIDPDSGHVKWSARLNDIGDRPVLGQSALFVGSHEGTFYSINPSTGTVNWHDSLCPGIGFETAPIVAANGYVYAQDGNDVLYCMNQADGTLIWKCDCSSYLGGTAAFHHRRARIAGLTGNNPDPSITSTGNIIVVGIDAVYCVAGYTAGPLDASAPWPKWQRNLSNTGSAGSK